MIKWLALFVVLLVACGEDIGPPVASVATMGTAAAGACHSAGGLPDPVCTPGATNPAVTQETIHSTICVSGWTATIRPTSSFTTALKKKQLVIYDYADKTLASYEEDHLISLEIGGNPTSPLNLWPESWTGSSNAHSKDQIENLLKSRVCSGAMTLADAQSAIATNWEVVK